MNVVQNNLISIVVLFILFLGVIKQVDGKDPVYRSFLSLIILNCVMLVLELIVFSLNGIAGTWIYVIMNSASLMYHLLIPVILFMTFIFFDFHFHRTPHKPFWYIIPFGALFITNLVLVFMSVSNGSIFQLDAQNTFSKGTYYIYYELAIYVMFVLIFIHAVLQRKKVDHNTFVALALFTMPLTGTMILVAFADFMYVTWNAFMISMVISYLFIQLDITSTDYLTGLKNRRGFEYLLFNLDRSHVKNEKIIGIILDVDNFKTINDVYGHHVGDNALKTLGNILKSAVRMNDFVSRTGGDEFAIIIQSSDANVENVVVERIYKKLNEYNELMPNGFKLHVSIGSDAYDEHKHRSISSFFEYLDKEMYRDKNEQGRTI